MTFLLKIFIGFVLGLLTSSYWNFQSAKSQLISDNIADIREFRDRIESYWLLSDDCSDDEEACAAARVRSSQYELNLFVDIAEDVLGGSLDEYILVLTDLYQDGMGGNFDRSSRKFNPALSEKCRQHVSHLIHILRNRRRKLTSLRGMGGAIEKLLKQSIVNAKARIF